MKKFIYLFVFILLKSGGILALDFDRDSLIDIYIKSIQKKGGNNILVYEFTDVNSKKYNSIKFIYEFESRFYVLNLRYIVGKNHLRNVSKFKQSECLSYDSKYVLDYVISNKNKLQNALLQFIDSHTLKTKIDGKIIESNYLFDQYCGSSLSVRFILNGTCEKFSIPVGSKYVSNNVLYFSNFELWVFVSMIKNFNTSIDNIMLKGR